MITQTEQLTANPLERAPLIRTKAPVVGEVKSTSGRVPWVHAFVILALVAGTAAWFYFKESHLAAYLAIGCSLLCVSAACFATARYCQNNWNAQLTRRSAEWDGLEGLLRAQLMEQTRREQDLLTEYAKLKNDSAAHARTNAELNEELTRRREAERALSQQRQDLARSKGVLELHVQARTQEMEKMQRRHELILDSAGEGICGLNMDGKIAFVNPAAARILGRTVDQMVGRSFWEFFPSLQEASISGDGEVKRGPLSECTLSRPDGSSFVLEYCRSPVKEGPRTVGEVFLLKDITERKQTEEALAIKAAELTRSNAELEQFAFVASHDLQEPLRKIQAFGDRLKVKCESIKLGESGQYLERMQNAAARMRTLIDDLLTFSRVISRTEPFAAVDLNQIAREVMADLEVRIERCGAIIEAGELPIIEADSMHMQQLFQNLIGNALKFHEPGAKPVVRIAGRLFDKQSDGADTTVLRRRAVNGEKAGGELWCELTVSDNGIGFDEKYLDRIFVVFQRLHGRQEYEGTGIGLAVCRRIVDRHGGTITAQSKPGQGATFIVQLPVKPVAKLLPKG